MTVPTGQLGNQVSHWILNKILASRDPSAGTDAATGRMILTYGRAYRWMVILLLAIASGFLVLGVVGSWGDPQALLVVSGIFGLFTLAMLIAFYEMACVRLTFSRDGLYRSSPAGRELFIPWSGVSGVTWSESFKWLTFKSRSGESIRVGIYRDGLGSLADMAAARLDATTDGGARLIRVKITL